MQIQIRAYVAILAAIIFWGISFVATKVALQAIAPCTLLLCRFTIAVSLLFPIWFLYGRERLHSKDLLLFILLGLMEPGLYFLFETWGLVYTSASTASLIIASMPVFVALMAAFFLKESLRLKMVLGILMTLAGVGGLIWQGSGTFDLTNKSMLGNMLILGAAFCASFYTIVSRCLRSRYQTLTLTMIQLAFSTLFFLPFAVYEWRTQEIPQLSLDIIIAVAFLAIFATFFAFFLYNYSLGVIEASKAAVFINLIPLVTVLTAWIYLGENLSGTQALGGIFILFGVSLTTCHEGKNKEKSWFQKFINFLKNRFNEFSFSFVPTQDYIKSSGTPIVGTSRSKSEH